jgi:chemotaxis protein histidine kinase CheA
MGATGLLDFFTLEAGEYLERLDGFVTSAGTGVPPLADFLTEARALRGAATMAKQTPIADVAAALERAAKAVRDGHLPWDIALRGVVVSAVDDLKILVRAVRHWSPDDTARATACAAELTRLTPLPGRPSTATPSLSTALAFIALEVSDIAAALGAHDGGDDDARRRIAPRLRALRGMAALRDLPPLGDIIDTVDDHAAVLERSGTPASDAVRRLFVAAAAALSTVVPRLRAGGTPDTDSPEIRAFAAATDAMQTTESHQERVVPISSLFFTDGGPHVVRAGASPPTTLAQRFRMEIVAPAEHLRRVVADARRAADGPAKAPAGRALSQALRDLEALAQSFGELDVARTLDRLRTAAATWNPDALQQIEAAGAVLSDPDGAEPLTERLRRIDAPATPPAPRVSVPTMMPAVPSQGAELHALLGRGLAGLTGLDATPLSPPLVVEEELVSIDDLLYRGRAALDRAIVVRDALRAQGGAPAPDALEELYALLDLARHD